MHVEMSHPDPGAVSCRAQRALRYVIALTKYKNAGKGPLLLQQNRFLSLHISQPCPLRSKSRICFSNLVNLVST